MEWLYFSTSSFPESLIFKGAGVAFSSLLIFSKLFLADRLREHIFDKLFETAEIAKFTPDQIRSYEDSLKYYRDLKNSLDTARAEGKVEGQREEKAEGAY